MASRLDQRVRRLEMRRREPDHGKYWNELIPRLTMDELLALNAHFRESGPGLLPPNLLAMVIAAVERENLFPGEQHSK
ncbi:hypothetical protein M1105_19195 [Limibaculum sp. FT325]|uniref:hypothetical protein n=1 Tax=Thermohalobaculum sediminis TaxID=2939436 RepID=UPI0020BD6E1C|nr:hypothetical protein [Limibaculum sediminis]MCL5779094.1 hypothetical protein [Limibaculum sediminis]